MSTQQTSQPQLGHGIVKQVKSGDTIVIRGHPRGGRPKEKTIFLSNITSPKLGHPANQNVPEAKDEPFAWETREFLRKKLIGKEVCFIVEKGSSANREYGTIYVGKDTNAENITETLIAEGFVDLRQTAIKSEAYQRLVDLYENAKTAGKGKHGPHASEHVRNIKWSVENPGTFKESLREKRIKGVVEHVRDGSTLRVCLLPNDVYNEYFHVMIMLSGIRCPQFRTQDSSAKTDQDQTAEQFAEEAQFFTECRLLQRDVEVILESVSNQNFLGTVLHPNGNIAEHLLCEGFAKCIDWSLQCVTLGAEKLRAAEKLAKEKRVRMWKDYTPSGPIIDDKEREFQAKVVEIVNGDAMVVKLADGSTKKIFLASIRPPKADANQDPKARMRPLYEVPFMFEAREFLRKKLIGKKVHVTIDYKQPANNNFAEKICCTVMIGPVNVAEALVSKGLGTALRYRADDDQRSSHYDELLAAELKAQKSLKGMHDKKEVPVRRINDLSGDLQKSKQFFPFLNRTGRLEAIVEFVASGSRLRLFVPRENCLLTFLLAGINCMRATRETKNGLQHGDPYGDEALAYTKDLCLQKEVQIEVENMDKAGNFIGWLWIDNINLSEALVKEGFAEVYLVSSKSSHTRALQNAEEVAQKKKLRIWQNQEVKQQEPKEDSIERKINYKSITVTEIRIDLVFFAQHVDEGPKLEEMTQKLRQEMLTNPPLPGAYMPKKGDICAAIFKDDGQWYRAKVDKIHGDKVEITFIDYGNKEITSTTNLATLPSTYSSVPHYAHEYALAFVKPPVDTETAAEARGAFFDEVDNRMLLLNVEYKFGLPYVTLLSSDEKEDIGKELVSKGFVCVDVKKDKKYQKIVSEYKTAQESAKQNRLNLWQYGDITEDDAKEFG